MRKLKKLEKQIDIFSNKTSILEKNQKKEIQYLLKFPWNGTSAVKTGKVLVINENLLLRPSPLISRAYKEILKVK